MMIEVVEEILKEKASLEREYLELTHISGEMGLTSEIYEKTLMANIAHSLSVIADTLADRKTEPITHDDYIETENDYLEARCLNCNNAKACKEGHGEDCVYEPKALPSAEPEIIRCKDCKYYINGQCWKSDGLDKLYGNVADDDFCSRGEREGE